METNQVQITTMLQFHITFTLASITLSSCAVAVISQQWPVTLLLPSDVIDFPLSFPGQKTVFNWCCVSFCSKRLFW